MWKQWHFNWTQVQTQRHVQTFLRTFASIHSYVMHQLYGLRTCEGKNKVPSTPPNTVREQIHTHSHPIETHTHKHTQSCTHSLQTHGENAHSAAVECQFRWIQVIQFAKQTLQYEVYIQWRWECAKAPVTFCQGMVCCTPCYKCISGRIKLSVLFSHMAWIPSQLSW